jgi:hypothetical protein
MEKPKTWQNGNSLAVFSSSLAELENLALLGVIYPLLLLLNRLPPDITGGQGLKKTFS